MNAVRTLGQIFRSTDGKIEERRFAFYLDAWRFASKLPKHAQPTFERKSWREIVVRFKV
jgi:hypothetical protein